jgi:deoxyhypusine synthase
LEIKDDFKYPYAMETDLVEISNNHIYFTKHLPRLTDVCVGENEFQEVEAMILYFAEKLLAE